MKPKLIIALILLVLFLVFLLQNTQVVTLRLYFWQLSMPQIILIPLVMLVGFALGYFVGLMRKKRKNVK
jgi:uncharacterized integral membrane protein